MDKLNSTVLQSAGLTQSAIDTCIYYIPAGNKVCCIILIHVYNYLVITNIPEWWKCILEFSKFVVKVGKSRVDIKMSRVEKDMSMNMCVEYRMIM